MKKIITFLILAYAICSHTYANIIIDTDPADKNLRLTTKYPHNKKFMIREGNSGYVKQLVKPTLDHDGYLIDTDASKYILGESEDSLAVYKKIKVDRNEVVSTITNYIKMTLNLPSTDAAAAIRSQKIQIFDPFCTPRELQIQWKKCNPQSWTLAFSCEEAEEITFNDSSSPNIFDFDEKGNSSTLPGQLNIKWKPEFSSTISSISFKESLITTRGDQYLFSANQDGIPFGVFQSLKYLFDGQVIGQFTNGYEKVIAKLALMDM